MSNVRFASNEFDDFEEGGGLYPGGSGVIEEIRYTLWDYDGKQPKDSAVAVYCKFQPTDGSNEGKPEEIYWSAGDASSFAPDPTGGHLVILKTRDKQSGSSNWAHVLKAFKDNCGLEKGKLSGSEGILALARTECTFTRIDQPSRQGLKQDDTKEKKFKPTFLVPTKARFPWEKGAGKSQAAAKPATTAATAAPAASPSTNGTGALDLSLIIKEVVEAAGGSIEFAALPKELLGKLSDVDRTQRTALIKEAKDVAKITALAQENGWTFDGKELVL